MGLLAPAAKEAKATKATEVVERYISNECRPAREVYRREIQTLQARTGHHAIGGKEKEGGGFYEDMNELNATLIYRNGGADSRDGIVDPHYWRLVHLAVIATIRVVSMKGAL